MTRDKQTTNELLDIADQEDGGTDENEDGDFDEAETRELDAETRELDIPFEEADGESRNDLHDAELSDGENDLGDDARSFYGGPSSTEPDDLDESQYSDDYAMYGQEAHVAFGDGTPNPPWREQPRRQAEWVELHRRFDESGSAAYPMEARRTLGWGRVSGFVRELAMRGRSSIVEEFGRDPIASTRWERRIEWLYKYYFRVNVSGIENIPSTGPAILVANHAGLLPLDSLLLMHAIRREHPTKRDVRPLIEDGFMHMPFIGSQLVKLGAVRACPENGERLLRNGELCVVFPEGHLGVEKLWGDRNKLTRFGRGGFVRLARKLGVPIIPIAITGSEKANPQLARIDALKHIFGGPSIPVTPTFPVLGPFGLLPLPVKFRIQIGEPMPMPRTRPNTGLQINATPTPSAGSERIVVSHITESIRQTITSMLHSMR